MGIGPQKTKSQLQAKSKADSKDDDHLQSISEYNMENPEEQNDDVSTGSEEMPKQSISETFQARVAKLKKEQMKSMNLNDQLEFRNVQNLSEYA